MSRKVVAASSRRPSRRASSARRRSSTVGESSASWRRPAPTLNRLLRVRPSESSERTETGNVTGAAIPRNDRAEARRREARLARGHPLFFDHALAVDTVTRERQRLEPLFGNRLVASLARPERAVVELLEGRDDVAEQPPVAVAELEEELSRVRGVGLVAQVLDRVVFRVFSVQSGPADLFGQLPLLFDKSLFEIREPILAHVDLLPYRARTQATNASTHPGDAQHQPRLRSVFRSRIVERQGRRVAPQALERIIGPRVFQKYVNEHVAVVEQHPAALGDALGVQDVHPFVSELHADGFGDRLQLRRRLAAADEEVIRDARHALYVEHHEIPGALVERGARRATDLPLARPRRHDPSAW